MEMYFFLFRFAESIIISDGMRMENIFVIERANIALSYLIILLC